MKDLPENVVSVTHDEILKDIQAYLVPFEKDIQFLVTKFKEEGAEKNYKKKRNQQGYSKWKRDVIKRFNGSCCICKSEMNLVAHHLNSYKYFPDLRMDLNNGVCLCSSCHNLFHDTYSNRNAAGHFFEFYEVIKNEALKNQLVKSHTIENIMDLLADLRKHSVEFVVTELKYLVMIIWNGRFYRGVK